MFFFSCDNMACYRSNHLLFTICNIFSNSYMTYKANRHCTTDYDIIVPLGSVQCEIKFFIYEVITHHVLKTTVGNPAL